MAGICEAAGRGDGFDRVRRVAQERLYTLHAHAHDLGVDSPLQDIPKVELEQASRDVERRGEVSDGIDDVHVQADERERPFHERVFRAQRVAGLPGDDACETVGYSYRRTVCGELASHGSRKEFRRLEAGL